MASTAMRRVLLALALLWFSAVASEPLDHDDIDRVVAQAMALGTLVCSVLSTFSLRLCLHSLNPLSRALLVRPHPQRLSRCHRERYSAVAEVVWVC